MCKLVSIFLDIHIYDLQLNISFVYKDFELMCETIQSSVSLIEQGRIIREFLHENGTQNSIEKWSKRVEQRESDADSLLLASSREEHPDWFVGKVIV